MQKVQQTVFPGQYMSEFMIVALVISAIAMGIFALCTEKKQFLPNLKAGFWMYAANGLANGITNFLVIFLSPRLAASVMFPVVSAGGIVLTFLISLFFIFDINRPDSLYVNIFRQIEYITVQGL